jgi:hypothetical protein
VQREPRSRSIKRSVDAAATRSRSSSPSGYDRRVRRGGLAGLFALLVVLFAGGFFAVGALSRGSADSPLIVLDQSIGGVAIGMSQGDVEALYGTPDDTLEITLRGGGTGLLVHYHVHGGELIVVYAGGRVVSIETDSSFYRTDGGIGPGTSKAGLGAFHTDFCSLGLWDGGANTPLDGVVTIFERNGNEVADVTITELGYYDLCESAGTSQEVQDPRASSSLLTVNVVPNGGGYVQSSGLEVDCPFECVKQFNTDATVTLVAHPTGGFAFIGWTGACGGAGSCVVTMDGPKSVTAHFSGEFEATTIFSTTKAATTTTTTTCNPDLQEC